MILHIGPISQFTKFTLEVFEICAPGRNILITTNREGLGGKKIIYPEGCGLYDASSRLGIFKYIKLIKSADMIIVHGMCLQGAFSFLIGNKGLKVWSGWGYDYYGNSKDPEAGILSNATINLIDTIGVQGAKKIPLLRSAWRSIYAFLVEAAAKKVHYFSAPLPNDYLIFKRRFKKASAEYAQLNYGDVVSSFQQPSHPNDGNDILVGNSSSATNNHIDIFNALKKLNIKGRKIVVPLTYGDPVYRDKLVEIGRNFFGDNFIPITTHLPLNDYLKLISGCNIAIMNHYRQQGIGNIGACFYFGMHVYLNKLNPAFDFFKERGAIFYSFDDLASSKLPEGLLSTSKTLINRAMLNGFWGDEVVRDNTMNLISKISEKVKY